MSSGARARLTSEEVYLHYFHLQGIQQPTSCFLYSYHIEPLSIRLRNMNKMVRCNAYNYMFDHYWVCQSKSLWPGTFFEPQWWVSARCGANFGFNDWLQRQSTSTLWNQEYRVVNKEVGNSGWCHKLSCESEGGDGDLKAEDAILLPSSIARITATV